MQAALAAMAAQTILLSPSPPLFSSNLHHPPPLFPSSTFNGTSLKLTRKSLTLSVSAATAPKPLAVVAATKKAVAVLKGTSTVEGVVTLTQEDNGLSSFTLFLSSNFFYIYKFVIWVLTRL
jgi:Cu-Zn family superoxide dismutase